MDQHFSGKPKRYNVIDFFALTQDEFNALTYEEEIDMNPSETDPTKKVIRTEVHKVAPCEKATCIFFKKYLEDRKGDGADVNQQSFFESLTRDEFEDWKAEEMTRNTSSPRIARTRDQVADFKKGIKRDPSQFPRIKNIDNWPTFKRDTLAQANAQDVADVFNPGYKARGDEEKDLFRGKQDYIYAVFCTSLRTDVGKTLVRDYEPNRDAQKIWGELVIDAEKSTVAKLNATQILKHIHTIKVEDWKGTTKAFILHYQEQIRLYDSMQPSNAQTADHAKLVYLQNAVQGIDDLRKVHTTAQSIAVATGKEQTYKEYEALLKAAADIYDAQNAPVKRIPTRSAELNDTFQANATEAFYDVDDGTDDEFSMDTSIDTIQAHMRNQSSMIPQEKYTGLSRDSKRAWAKLPDEVRTDLLRALLEFKDQASGKPPSLSDKPGYNRTRTPTDAMNRRQVNFEDFITTDDGGTSPSSLTASTHDTSDTPGKAAPDTADRALDVLAHVLGINDASHEPDTLIASVTKQHREWAQPNADDVPQGDLRKMLSQRGKPASDVKANRRRT
jgi:hypothetical protein